MTTLPEKMRSALMKARYYERAKAQSAVQTYRCLVDEFGDSIPIATTQLVTNSTYHYRPNGDPPDEVLERGFPLDAFLLDDSVGWIKDPGTEVWFPFWSGGECADALASLLPGEPEPKTLKPAVRSSLAAAKILVERDYEKHRRALWTETCQSARRQYENEGFVVVRDLLDPLSLNAMRRFYQALLAKGDLPLGDEQVSGRYVLHSEVLASYLHPQLASLVGRIAGEPVKPSYVYFSSYRPGASLPKHTDRVQCEFSISFLADYDPDPAGPSGWPLFLDDRRRGVTSAADLAVGDALFYRGRELAHYRHPLPEGHRSTSLFFHYVRPDFNGDLW